MPTPPVLIDSAPAVPDSTAPETTFDTAYEAFNGWEKDELQPKVNALAQNVYDNAVEAGESADLAQSAAAIAADVQDAVLAAANFKGLWSSLSGALSKPACVKHGGRFWLLLNNLANVAASEPGVTADWTSLDAGVTPSALITGNTTVVPGVRYLIGAAGLILSMVGVIWAKGDYFGVREVIASGSYTINFSTTKDRTVTRGSVVIKAGFRQLDRYFEDATRGLT